MVRSVVVLALILMVVVILTVTAFNIKQPVGEPAANVTTTTMSLRPYRYNHQLDISSETYPSYDLNDLLNRGHEFWRKGDRKRAEDIFKTALLFDPDNPVPMKSIGEIVFLDRRYDEAINYFSQYCNINPDGVESYTNLAISYLCANRLTAAEGIVNTGFSKISASGHGPLYLVSACLKQRKGDSEMAKEYLIRAHELLGSEMLKNLNHQWSDTLTEIPIYDTLIEGPSVDVEVPEGLPE